MDQYTAEQKSKSFFEISSSQSLDSTGRLGALLFIFSPVLEAACYWWLLNELADYEFRRNLWGPGLGLIACGISFLGGLVMVIVGREQRHIVREVDCDPTNKLWN
ncbi:hypothetical protein ACFHWW_04880 [Ensifer sp. P24N7]|uniref:hypothetical protein n=1 Tax=Sinorhizobium sp. P24N7 TaxID=3348358 RepID=UPI0035F4C9A8